MQEYLNQHTCAVRNPGHDGQTNQETQTMQNAQRSTPNAQRSTRLGLVTGVLLFAGLAQAASLTWDTVSGDSAITGGAGTWDDNGNVNWTSDGGTTNQVWLNSTPDTATFAGASGGLVTLGEPIIANSLTFNTSGYTVGTAGDATNTLTFSGAKTITLAANAQINSIMKWTGTVTMNLGGNTLTIGGPTNSAAAAPYPAAPGVTVKNGTLVLSRPASYFGALGNTNLTIGDGSANATVRVTGTQQLQYQSNQTIYKNGTLDLNGYSAGWPLYNVTFMGGGSITSGSFGHAGGALTYTPQTGGVKALMSANYAASVGITIGDDTNLPVELEISGMITSGSVSKSGAGALLLSGNNTTTGTTTVRAGTILVNGTTSGQGNYTVGGATITGNATLGGTGTIGLASGNSVTVQGTSTYSATLSPGNSIGTLTIDGNLVIGDYGKLLIEISGSQSDLLIVDGDVDLTSALNVLEFSGTFSGSDNYTILTYTGTLTGSFASLPELPGPYRYEIGNGAIILAIPEPASLGLLALGGLLALRRRR